MADESPKLCTASEINERLLERIPPTTCTIVIEKFSSVTHNSLRPLTGCAWWWWWSSCAWCPCILFFISCSCVIFSKSVHDYSLSPPPVHTYNILLTIGSSGASLIYCPGKVLQTEKIAHVHVIGTMFGAALSSHCYRRDTMHLLFLLKKYQKKKFAVLTRLQIIPKRRESIPTIS